MTSIPLPNLIINPNLIQIGNPSQIRNLIQLMLTISTLSQIPSSMSFVFTACYTHLSLHILIWVFIESSNLQIFKSSSEKLLLLLYCSISNKTLLTPWCLPQSKSSSSLKYQFWPTSKPQSLIFSFDQQSRPSLEPLALIPLVGN